jgi:hypothetical protein
MTVLIGCVARKRALLGQASGITSPFVVVPAYAYFVILAKAGIH